MKAKYEVHHAVAKLILAHYAKQPKQRKLLYELTVCSGDKLDFGMFVSERYECSVIQLEYTDNCQNKHTGEIHLERPSKDQWDIRMSLTWYDFQIRSPFDMTDEDFNYVKHELDQAFIDEYSIKFSMDNDLFKDELIRLKLETA